MENNLQTNLQAVPSFEQQAVSQSALPSEFRAARFIKEIGRGKDGARSLSRQDAFDLYSAMLDGRVSDLEMGGILLAMRIKGESIDEIAGFLDAAVSVVVPMQAPIDSEFAPIVIPSYNGARKKPNLTPLLAMLLAQAGAPVLLHGVMRDAGRVATADILKVLGLEPAQNAAQAQCQLQQTKLTFMPIQILAPKMHRILAMRAVLGVRNSTHTLVKLLQPFVLSGHPALRLNSYTHPEYQLMLDTYLRTLHAPQLGATFLMRATEGEAVASTGRAQQIDCYNLGQHRRLCETEAQLGAVIEDLPLSAEAVETAAWTQKVLAGEIAVPINIARQRDLCLQIARELKLANEAA
ncbi:DNA-binding protein YbiB [Undibacterium sp. Di24W]|uniref:DNA-binding protein YbiB n=1 Tax=Undibacterium sp. Di24W TaxID=3413033 RepID=UPI003BF13DBB